MKRITIAVLLSALFAVGSAAQQKQEQSGEMSLGDYARKVREKQSKDGKDHSWTNDALRNNSNALSTGTVPTPTIEKGGLSERDQIRNLRQALDLVEVSTNVLDRTDISKLADVAGVPNFPGRELWEANALAPRRAAMVRSARAYVEAGREFARAYESGRQADIFETRVRFNSSLANYRYARLMYDTEIEMCKRNLAERGVR